MEFFPPAKRQHRCCANYPLCQLSTCCSTRFVTISLHCTAKVVLIETKVILFILTCYGKQRHLGKLGQSGAIHQTWAAIIIIAISCWIEALEKLLLILHVERSKLICHVLPLEVQPIALLWFFTHPNASATIGTLISTQYATIIIGQSVPTSLKSPCEPLQIKHIKGCWNFCRPCVCWSQISTTAFKPVYTVSHSLSGWRPQRTKSPQ